jgi:hypothetical protein
MVIREEVAVVGAGPAGIAAAIAAARSGAKVVLIEKNPFIGGNAALGLSLHNFYDFSGRRCIDGIAGEIVERLKKMGGTPGSVDVKNAQISKVTPVNEDLLQVLCLQMLKEEGIRLLPQTTCCDVTTGESAIDRVRLYSKWKTYDLEAKVYIDCTGDADLSAAAGLPYEKGRPDDRLLQPMGQMFRLGNVDMETFLSKAGVAVARGVKPGETKESVVWFSASLSRWNDIIAEQKLFMGQDRLFWGNSVMPDEYNINITRIAGLDATQPEEMGKAEFVGKEQVFQVYRFFKEYVDGFKNSFVAKLAPFTGARETRRIVGEYQLAFEDFFEGRRFEDTIALSGYPVDIHDPKGGSHTTFIQVRDHRPFAIPYRCLYNNRCQNLLVAGRPISTTHEVHGATRVMAPCMATGQAAGVAGRMAAHYNIPVGKVDVPELQARLKKQKAILSRED